MSVGIGVSGVTSQNSLASLAAVKILENGGNAFDAAIAASSVLSVVLPHTSGLGGDAFLLAVTENNEIISYNASGYSPGNMDVDRFITVKPVRGPLTVTVPGLVRQWEWLSNNYGKKSLRETLRFSYSLAQNGFYIQPQVANAIQAVRKELSPYESWKKLYGETKEGEYKRLPQLANVLKTIMEKGADEFYEGRLAEEIITELNKQNVPLTLEDLSDYHGEKTNVIQGYYRGYTVYELPPNSQGIVTLVLLKILEGEDIDKELLYEGKTKNYLQALEKVYLDRDVNLAEIGFMRIPIKDYLNIRRLKESSVSIGAPETRRGRDTTFFITSDKEGNMVGFIQSLFYPFGSGIVVKDIPFQNRGAGFSYKLGLPNSPAPRKKPLHTLSITLLIDDRDRRYMIGCAGGDYRPQIHAQVIMNLLFKKTSLWNAVQAPRIILRDWGKKRNNVIIEKSYPVTDASSLDRFTADIIEYPGPTGTVHAGIKDRDRIELVADVRGQGSVLFMQ